MDVPVLETERLRLRGFREADLDAYARMCADSETMRYIGEGRPQTRAEAWRGMAAVIGHWSLRGYGLWAAEDRRTGALVGRIGLYRPEGWPGLEVGWLVDRRRWGEGLAPEGAAAALDHAFDVVGAERMISLIRPENAPSIRVAEKLGERYAETLQLLGEPADCWAIDRDTWQARPR